MEDNKKTNNKKNILDWIVAAILLIALVVCYFFWGCSMDLPVSLLAVVILIAGVVLLQMQHKKLNDANKDSVQ